MSHSNRFTLFVITLFATTLLANNLASASAAPALPPNTPTGSVTCDKDRTIQVSGSAVINVVPDQITVQLGVTSNDSTPGGVHTKNTAAIKQVIAALHGLEDVNIADQDISTDYYVIQPLYNNYDSQIITGYRINNMVSVKLRDASKISAVLAAALESGANEVIAVQFETTLLRKYRDDARAAAMKAAQEKAQALASAAGTQTGCVMSIDENSWSSYGGYSWWGGRTQLQSQNVMQNATSSNQPSNPDSPISLGQIAVQAEVQVRYSLK